MMQNFSLLKQEFLKKWIEGLKACNSTGRNMGILERKKAIKLSADLAMAFARGGSTSWSRAVIAKASNNQNNNINNTKDSKQLRLFRSKKIVKRSRNVRKSLLRKKISTSKADRIPSLVAKKLVRKRTQVLRRLLPGGEQCLDEAALVREALDYILSLKAEADVMRSYLARATMSTVKLVNEK